VNPTPLFPLREIESALFYGPDSYKAWFATVQDSSAATEVVLNDEESAVPEEREVP